MRTTLGRVALVATIAFPVAVLAYSTFFYFLGFASVLLIPLVALIGAVAFVCAAVVAVRTKARREVALVIVVIAIWALWILAPTRYLGAYARFAVERSQYEEAARELIAGGTPACVAAGKCLLDPGPPQRLAFSWDGLLDNWFGVVYDPSREVTDVEKHRKIFGGDLLGCFALTGPYFVCTFT